MRSILLAVSILCMSSAAAGQIVAPASDDGSGLEPPAWVPVARQEGPDVASERGRGHLVMWDVLAIGAAAGVVAGRADGYCQSKFMETGPIVGVPVLTAVLMLPELVDHPRHPVEGTPTIASFEVLKARTDWRTRVEILQRDRTSVIGTLVEIGSDAVVVEGPRGRQILAQTAILEIDKLERDPIWDVPLASGVMGGLWGLLWAHDCSDDDLVTRAPRDRMAMTGAAVLGATGLAWDVLHKKRTVLFLAGGGASTPSVRINPVMKPRGIGVSLSWQF